LLDVVVERADSPFVQVALADTDRRVGEGKPVAPSFLLACVLWADVREGWAKRLARKEHPHPALQDAIDEVFDARIGDVSGRGKLAADMREIWMMQPRFEKRVGSTPFGLVEQPRFRAGFDFLRLRADIEEVDIRLADWWQEFSMASDSEREDLVQTAKAEQQALQVAAKPRVRRAPRPEGAPAQVETRPELTTENVDGDAPKKRRRRRRKPGAAGDQGIDGGQAE
jgi:poly(A) polymerase